MRTGITRVFLAVAVLVAAPSLVPGDAASASAALLDVVTPASAPRALPSVSPGGFVGISPSRVLDTRVSGQGPCVGSSERKVTVAGTGRVPSDAAAVSVNVTVVWPSAPGFVTVWPSDQTQPSTSSVNFTAGQVVANAVTVAVGTDGQISLWSNAGCPQVVVDVTGWYGVGTPVGPGGFSGVTPRRVLDTREAGQGPCVGSTERKVTVAGIGEVPADAAAVSVNVTVVWPSAAGFVTVWPSGQARPEASSVNFTSGQVVANAVTLPVGSNGQISLWTNVGCPQLVVDVTGSFAPGSPVEFGGLRGVGPTRVLDSRESGHGPCVGTAPRTLTIPGLPAETGAVAVNVTVVWPSAEGFVSVWPAGEPQPSTSSVNFIAGGVVANQVTVKLGTANAISLATNVGCPHIVIDLTGAYRRPPPALNDVKQIAAGADFTCAAMLDGTAKCWGASFGSTPTSVAGLSGVVQIDAGSNHACALLADGSVRCWGSNSGGQLGDGTTTNRTAPVAVTGLNGVVRIATGSSFTCALLAAGATRCWGVNWSDQLGDASHTTQLVPVTGPTVAGAVDIAAGADRTCVRTQAGEVRCWGAKPAPQPSSPVPVTVATNAAHVAVGNSAGVCVTLADGSVQCVGSDSPPVDSSPHVAATSLGVWHNGTIACALLQDSTVQCKGWGADGSSGTGAFAAGSASGPVTGLVGAVAVDAGSQHVCALLDDATVRCWGNDDSGQLGDGAMGNHLTGALGGLESAQQVAATGGGACALLADGTVRCWGGGTEYPQVSGSTLSWWRPTELAQLPRFTKISAGWGHYCGVTQDAHVACWTFNAGTFHLETGLDGVDQVVDISAGYDDCARRFDGKVWCWRVERGSKAPAPVPEIVGASQISAAQFHACAVVSGLVKCWGYNDRGDLGQDPSVVTQTDTPTVVAGIDHVVRVSAGSSETCAVKSDATLWCWGGGYARTGLGWSPSSVPQQVPGLSGVADVATGDYRACALLIGGTVSCWGYTFGQGTGSLFYPVAPTPVAGLSGVATLSQMRVQACVVVPGQGVRCWGSAGTGGLGDGRDDRKPRPVTVLVG